MKNIWEKWARQWALKVIKLALDNNDSEIYEARITRMSDGIVISVGFYESIPRIEKDCKNCQTPRFGQLINKLGELPSANELASWYEKAVPKSEQYPNPITAMAWDWRSSQLGEMEDYREYISCLIKWRDMYYSSQNFSLQEMNRAELALLNAEIKLGKRKPYNEYPHDPEEVYPCDPKKVK